MEHDVSEWELGLPSYSDLTPLSHRLIPPELASTFSISPEPHRTFSDVFRASQNTVSSLRGNKPTEPVEEEVGKEKINKEEDGDEVVKSNVKRPRLVWTPQLHKRFVEVVGHLGIKKVVPKTIMQVGCGPRNLSMRWLLLLSGPLY